MEHENFRKNPVPVVGHPEPPNPGATGGFTVALFVIAGGPTGERSARNFDRGLCANHFPHPA
jgi:hypothetical protein